MQACLLFVEAWSVWASGLGRPCRLACGVVGLPAHIRQERTWIFDSLSMIQHRFFKILCNSYFASHAWKLKSFLPADLFRHIGIQKSLPL